MRRVVQDRAPPVVERQPALHEALAQCRRRVGLAIAFVAMGVTGFAAITFMSTGNSNLQLGAAAIFAMLGATSVSQAP